MVTRPTISDAIISKALDRFRCELAGQVKKKGRSGFVSSHETRGCIDEEVDEFAAAVHSNDLPRMRQELTDVMTAAFWGLASELAGGWDR